MWKLMSTWSCKNNLPIIIVLYHSFQATFFKTHLYPAGVVKIFCQSPLYHFARSKWLSLKSISSKYTFMYIFQKLLLQYIIEFSRHSNVVGLTESISSRYNLKCSQSCLFAFKTLRLTTLRTLRIDWPEVSNPSILKFQNLTQLFSAGQP